MLRKGDEIDITIASLAPGGEGVSRQQGIPIFVGRTAPGDAVKVRLFDVRKDFARAEVIEVLQPSALRQEPPCKLFKVCGGCQWQHISYSGQLEAKTEIVRQAVKHIGKLPPDLVRPALAADEPLFYRNKAQFPVQSVKASGRILAGYYKEGSHELVNIKHCPVQPEPLDRALAAVKDALETRRLTAYDEATGNGLVRHIALRFSFAESRILATLVLNTQPPLNQGLQAKLKDAAFSIMESVPEVCGVCVNFNSERGNRITGDTSECLAGADHLTEVLHSHLQTAPARLRQGIAYRLSPTSFFQVNTRQAELLLDQVLLAVAGEGDQSRERKIPLLIDAYAGVGTMALWLAPIAERVLAIEEWPAAIEDGRLNCRLNGVDNVEFRQAKVEDAAAHLVAQALQPGVVVVDPPRKGLHQRALESLVAMQPGKIVYVSCNPATLSRDLQKFAEGGYKTKQVQPVDLFPQTYHVESVATLEPT